MQPISEERVLERATKASRVVQIIDNIGKDNEVKAKKEKTRSSARNSGTAISRQKANAKANVRFTQREKVTRADGGCLGFRRRGRTWQAAQRRGDPQAGSDPRMSEWGNPAGRMPATGCMSGANAGN